MKKNHMQKQNQKAHNRTALHTRERRAGVYIMYPVPTCQGATIAVASLLPDGPITLKGICSLIVQHV